MDAVLVASTTKTIVVRESFSLRWDVVAGFVLCGDSLVHKVFVIDLR